MTEGIIFLPRLGHKEDKASFCVISNLSLSPFLPCSLHGYSPQELTCQAVRKPRPLGEADAERLPANNQPYE